jgi:hypothetical protein
MSIDERCPAWVAERVKPPNCHSVLYTSTNDDRRRTEQANAVMHGGEKPEARGHVPRMAAD